MNIKYEDKTYTFDLEDMDLVQAKVMKEAGFPSLKGFTDALAEVDLDALGFAFWLMLDQSGIKQDPKTLSFKPLKFLRAISEATAQSEDSPKEG